MKKIWFQLIVLLISYASANAQHQFMGKLIDKKTKEPIEAAAVKFSAKQYILTDKEGFFTINTDITEPTIAISSIGYQPKEIQLKNNETAVIELESSNVNLTEVVVAAQGSNSKSYNVISKIDLNMRPAKSSQELLRLVPGLFIAQHQGGGKAEQIFLRGFDIDHGTDIAITVDGMPVNMVSHAHGQGYADLHFLIPEIVKNIDYGTGTYYAAQGNFNTAGYASFETMNKLQQNRIQLEAGRFNTVRTLGMFQLLNKPKHNAYIASEYLYSDGPFKSKQHFNRFNIFGKYNWQLSNYHQLQVSGSTFSSRWDASGQIPQRAVDAGIIDRFGAIDDKEGGTTTRTNWNLQLTSNKNKIRTTNQLYYSRYTFDLFSNFTFFLNDSINGDQIRQKEKREIVGYNGSLTIKHFTNKVSFTTTAGWGIRADRTYNSELSSTLNKITVREQKALGNIREINSFSYINENISIGKLVINPAIRVDHFYFQYRDQLNPSLPQQQAIIASPKLNLLYNHNSNLQLFLKAGKGFHSNDTRVVVQKTGKETLPAAYGSDLGIVWKPVKNLVINTAVWYLYLQQEFVYVGDEGVVEEGGRTQRLGVDISSRYQLSKQWFADVNLNYALPRALDIEKGKNFIPLAPAFTSIGGISYQGKKGLNGSLRYRYIMNRPANEDNSVIAKGYCISDFTLNYTKPKYEVGLAVENLFNTKWNEAQFETTSRLQNEPAAVTELHFTPGVPLFAKLKLAFFF
jgi:outer membrane receptor for Fe3+-dicitrate